MVALRRPRARRHAARFYERRREAGLGADRRRGELALLGLEATVEPGDGDNGRWYRVYLGPFESRSEMARARSLTAQADMDTLLLKRELP